MNAVSACIFERLLTDEDVDELKNGLHRLGKECFSNEPSSGRWRLQSEQPPSHRYSDPLDSWFPVVFDQAGNLISEEITLPFRSYERWLTLKKIAAIALKWLAEKRGWRNTTREMALSIVQHRALPKGFRTKEIPWHRDSSDWTLIILLDETKWQGGRFLFKARGKEALSFQPKKGWGLFFTNKDTKHTLESLIANEENVDRTILTFHEVTRLFKETSNLSSVLLEGV